MVNWKQEWVRFKSFLKHLGVGFGIAVGLIVVGSFSIYFGVSETTSLGIISLAMVCVPISAGVWLIKDVVRVFREGKKKNGKEIVGDVPKGQWG